MIKPLSSKILKQISREQLLGKYAVTTLSYFIMQMILSMVLWFAASMSSGTAAGLIVYYAIYFIVLMMQGIFITGQNYLYLRIARENACSIKDMWFGFTNYPDKAISIRFFVSLLYILFGLPFYIVSDRLLETKKPGYIAPCIVFFLFFAVTATITSLLFSQALYLLVDSPQEKPIELLRQSVRLMKGHKARLLYIQISFIGMYALVVITMGIGILLVYPYVSMVRANFYQNLISMRNQDIDIQK